MVSMLALLNVMYLLFFSTPATVLGAGASSGLNSSRSPCLQGCGRMGQTSRCCLFIPTFARCLSTLVESPFLQTLCIVQSMSGGDLGFTRWSIMPPSNLEVAILWILLESLCGAVWRWLDQSGSLPMCSLPSRGSIEWRKLFLGPE